MRESVRYKIRSSATNLISKMFNGIVVVDVLLLITGAKGSIINVKRSRDSEVILLCA